MKNETTKDKTAESVENVDSVFKCLTGLYLGVIIL